MHACILINVDEYYIITLKDNFLLIAFFYRHKLFAPQVFHVGAIESFTFTSYSLERFDVTATVSYDDCSCEANRRRTCKDNGEVFSQATGGTRQGEKKWQITLCV